MMKAAVIAALAIPVLCASGTEYSASLQNDRTQADQLTANLTQVAAELESLGVKLPDAEEQTKAPEAPQDGDTHATADLGMFFDAAESKLVYLGNVRVTDPRGRIFAKEQLHLYLEDFLADKKKDSDDTPPAAPDSEPVVYNPPAEQEEEAEQEATKPGETAEKDTLPVSDVVAHSVIADMRNNAIYIYSPAAGEELVVAVGENKVCITPTADQSARILADPDGNILLEGSRVQLSTVDNAGGTARLTTTGGHVYYHAATHTLYAPGKSELIHPDGSLNCTEMLCVHLAPAEEEASPRKKGFMHQFTGMRFKGIATATARGQVTASGKATENRLAVRAEGDELQYNGQTGQCSLTGKSCRLVYGSSEIQANEGLHLLPNGDIELRGSDIHGNYERESSTTGQMLRGTFHANANVIFRAELGTISTERGIRLADDEADFSCTGPVHLVLTRKADTTPKAPGTGMPNLAITQFSDISRARATGQVTAHRFDLSTRKCIGELQAESVETDLTTGETLLTGVIGEPLKALYNGNKIEAIPAEGSAATMELLANGDLKLNGDRISAELQSENGITTASCRSYVRLIRSANRLETGSSTVLNSPSGILTTNGSLHAVLTTKGEASTANKKYPGFSFNYDGISQASTNEGCTVRTEKGSMQCTGAVRLVMNTDNKSADKMMGGLKSATARGNVAIAGRDNTGRALRATGDLLEINTATGMKVLSGRQVTLGDANVTHFASGAGACIRIDAKNNASIHGEKHTTHATNIRQQINDNKNKNQQKK